MIFYARSAAKRVFLFQTQNCRSKLYFKNFALYKTKPFYSIRAYVTSLLNMDEHFEGFPEGVTDWETIMQLTKLDLDYPLINEQTNHLEVHRQFARQDIVMYGLMPKMEGKIFVKCKDCKLIFSPIDILFHKTCIGTCTPTKLHVSDKKSKSRSGSSKKAQKNFTLRPAIAKTSSPNRNHNKDKDSNAKINANQSGDLKMQDIIVNLIPEPEIKGTSPDVPSPSCLSNDSLSLDGDSSSPIISNSRNTKKFRKAKSVKEFDPDRHCGVIDSHKGPCLRSITCSNHRIQLKKLVQGRSKDIHQLITEKRLARERDLLNQSLPENGKTETSDLAEQIPVVITTHSEENLNEIVTPDLIEIEQNIMDCAEEVIEFKDETKQSNDLIENIHEANLSENFIASTDTMTPLFPDFTVKSLENYDFVPLEPMSPLLEYNIDQTFELSQIQPMSPLKQDTPLKEESFLADSISNVPVTDDPPTTFKIPDMEFDCNNFGSHPKPMALPNYGMKKIGGAVLVNKRHLHLQRNDILRAVNDSRINFSLFGGTSLSRMKRNHCNSSLMDNGLEYKQMRVDPNLNHFLMQCEIRKPFDDVSLEECLQENFGRNTFTSTIDFE